MLNTAGPTGAGLVRPALEVSLGPVPEGLDFAFEPTWQDEGHGAPGMVKKVQWSAREM